MRGGTKRHLEKKISARKQRHRRGCKRGEFKGLWFKDSRELMEDAREGKFIMISVAGEERSRRKERH